MRVTEGLEIRGRLDYLCHAEAFRADGTQFECSLEDTYQMSLHYKQRG